MRVLPNDLLVIIAGVTSEEDALLSVALGANTVGFDFALGARQVTPDLVRDILRRLPNGVFTLGSFSREIPTVVVDVANRIGLSMVELDPTFSREAVEYIRERVGTVILRCEASELRQRRNDADYLSFPLADGFVWNFTDSLEELDGNSPVIFAGDVDATQIGTVTEMYPVAGVSILGAAELSVGVKDPAMLGDLIRSARWGYENSTAERAYDEWKL